MIVALTGASGFLGDAVRRELASTGVRVRAVVRDLARLGGRGHARLEAYRADLRRPETAAKAFAGADVLLHAVGRSGPHEPGDATAESEVAILEGTLAAARAAGVRRAVVVNSALVLGPTEGYGFANERTRPIRAQYVCEEQRRKLAARDVARRARGPAFDVVVLYPAPLLGPSGPAPRGWVRALLDAAARRALPVWPRDLGRPFCVVRVEDAARAAVAALERAEPQGEYVLASEAASFETLLLGATGAGPLGPRGSDALVRAAAKFAGWRRAFAGKPAGAEAEIAEILLHAWSFASDRAEARLGATFRPFVDAFVPTVAAGA